MSIAMEYNKEMPDHTEAMIALNNRAEEEQRIWDRMYDGALVGKSLYLGSSCRKQKEEDNYTTEKETNYIRKPFVPTSNKVKSKLLSKLWNKFKGKGRKNDKS